VRGLVAGAARGHARGEGASAAQAEQGELRLAERKGEVVNREQVVREGQGFVKSVRARLLAIPRRLVQLGVVPPAREGQVSAIVREALSEMATWSVAPEEPTEAVMAGGSE
jgi:hypothetical protein